MSTDESADENAEAESPEAAATGRDTTRYLYLGALGVLVVLAVVGLFGFYTSTSRVIEVWVAEQYQPVFSAAFNLVVLLAATAGIARLAPLLREA